MDRVPPPLTVQGHQRVDGLVCAGGVILADRIDPPARGVDLQVGVANIRVRSDGDGTRATLLAVDPLVVVIREPHRPAAHRVLAAPIFMDARARVEARRRYVLDLSGRGAADYDPAAGFQRAAFDPVEVVAVPARHAQVELPLQQQVDGDGRRPRPVRRALAQEEWLGRRIIKPPPSPPPPQTPAAPVVRPRRSSSYARVSTRRAP